MMHCEKLRNWNLHRIVTICVYIHILHAYFICVHCLHIYIYYINIIVLLEYVLIIFDMFHLMNFIAYPPANYHGNRKSTLENTCLNGSVSVAMFSVEWLYFWVARKFREGVSVGGSFPLLYSLCNSASFEWGEHVRHVKTPPMVHFWLEYSNSISIRFH